MDIHPHDSLIVIATLKESDGVTIGFRPSHVHTFGPKSTEIINRKMAELKTELDAIRLPKPVCPCIDCGGSEPDHSKDCEYMNELHGDVLTQCEACNDILAECSCPHSTT